jgi:uncharacterized protein involved in type VI secretion and phage assembly
MSTTTEQLIGQMADYMNTRFFGKYRGTVTDIDDNEGKIGRIKAKVPAVFGDTESPWALPALPFAGPKHGLFLLPEVDDGVWIEFEGGNPALPIWSGFWWGKESEIPGPKTSKARVFATSAGHQLVLDDDADKVHLFYAKDPNGDAKGEITMSSSGITIKFGQCSIEIKNSEINVNDGMLKITTSGASLVNEAMKVGS